MSTSRVQQTSLAFHRSAFYLSQIDLFNWGSFSGYHSAEINLHGTAIIGPTGSGKTTIIDAFITLLTANPKYNLASTGGHEGDRSLMSYIRGVSGEGNDIDEDHILRTGKTTTGISAHFSNGEDVIRICAIFWVNSSSNSAADRNDMWIINEREDQSLQDWLEIHKEGGLRALRRYGQSLPHVRLFNVKKRYLADLRQFFEVGKNAFTLLNRTSGLKQINSVNEVFREFVLEDHSSFDRAEEVIKEFDNLEAIYNELESAQKQQELLIPVQKYFSQYKNIDKKLIEKEKLKKILPVWFALEGARLWSEKAAEWELGCNTTTEDIDKLNQDKDTLHGEAEALRESYLKAGGGRIEHLKTLIETQEELVQEKQRNARDYQKITQIFEIKQEISLKEFEFNKQWAAKQEEKLEKEKEQKKMRSFEFESQSRQYKEEVSSLAEKIIKIESRPASNLPANFQDFRSELAQELHTSDGDLPFVAELVQVKQEENSWRGAIERAIGSHRLRIIVPTKYLDNALQWINNRDNRLHVRLLEGKEIKKQIEFFKNGFIRKLNFKAHPHREPLKDLLIKIDRHCVATPDELRKTPHGMTTQGLMSGRDGIYEKQDKRPLNKDWMTGFDNKDRLKGLKNDLNNTKLKFNEFQKKYEESFNEVRKVEEKILLLKQLLELNFDKIDLSKAERKLNDSKNTLHKLTAPNSDTTEIHRQYKRAEKKLKDVEEKVASKRESLAVIKSQLKDVLKRLKEAQGRAGGGLTSEEQELAKKHIPNLKIDQITNIDNIEREARAKVDESFSKLSHQINKCEKDIIRAMSTAKNNDLGSFNDIGTEIQDVPDYLKKLKVLNEEALPRKRNRFLAYLNQSSDQGVVQLLANIENEVSIIEENIDDLNKTLVKVDYEPGAHIQLMPQRMKDPILSDLEKKQRRLLSLALADDEGKNHFRALENVIKIIREASENRRTTGAKALLDPRYRLNFIITKLDNESKKIIEKRSGSKSGSGGEKEIIASYILVASLNYTLCSQNIGFPIFSTMVLDEAFSKTSRTRASRIVSAIKEFKLQPLFVTPNKELRLLRNHTKTAIFVHRKKSLTTLTTFTWEQLDDYFENKWKKKSEIT